MRSKSQDNYNTILYFNRENIMGPQGTYGGDMVRDSYKIFKLKKKLKKND